MRIEQNPYVPESPRRKLWVRSSPVWAAVFVLAAGSAGYFLSCQDRYGRNLENELRKGAFSGTVSIFADSRTLELGALASAGEIVDELRGAGFTESRQNPIGWFEIQKDGLVVHAATRAESTRLRFSANKFVQILALPDNSALERFQLDCGSRKPRSD